MPILLVASSCTRIDSGAAGVLLGSAAPKEWLAAPGSTTLIWAVTPEQLVACETAAFELREIRRRHVPDLRITIASTRENHGVLRDFLAKQRLSDILGYPPQPRVTSRLQKNFRE
jgi:hypothetical protein